MASVSEKHLQCPYCGEPISILVDETVEQQNYIEDCQVCCRPIVIDVTVDFDGTVTTGARTENE